MREFEDELAALDRQSLRRRLRSLESRAGVDIAIAGNALINFASNDYLGLADHPAVKAALIRAVEKWGAGSGAARLVCGTLAPHTRLESVLAEFKGTEAALGFSSGYAAALGTLSAVATRGDIVILDKLVHASLIDGARLSGATLRIFAHHDLEQLEARLRWAAGKRAPHGRIIVVTESIFSMDGDAAPLREIIDLKDRFGALLLVDEAHAFGVLGRDGRGLADECGVAGSVDIQLGTLSKAAGLGGGFIAADRGLVDLIINRARAFVFSTAPPPALAAAAAEVVESIFQGDEGDRLRRRVRSHARRLAAALGRATPPAAIIPWLIGDESAALAAAAAVEARGFFVPAIRFPTVSRGQARLRITVSARHEPDQLDALAGALREAAPR